jgi:glutamyl-tRNA synthetase
MTTPRVRFAPSPTGFLHVGGARTALFNWLFARREGGVFVLRIEDTDIARSSDEMVQAILDGLAWLGLTHDEGPFFQTASRDAHVARAQALLDTGKAYRCFCTPGDIDARRARAGENGAAWKYDRLCLSLDPGEVMRRVAAGTPWCIRFRVPAGITSYDDLVHGETTFQNADIEDLVLLRSDGTPTYNLSCVSDDLDMSITHVVRGDDHISNTPKQLLLYEALGALPPRFGHLPLILGEDRKRLSKRHGAVSVMEYARSGYLPEALFNFLALLGWSPGGDREIVPVAEMVQAFSFDGVGSRSAVFDHDKLLWMNGEYLRRRTAGDLAALSKPWFEKEGLWSPELDGDRRGWFLTLLDLLKERCRLLGDLARDARAYLTPDFPYDPEAAGKHLTPEAAPRLRALREELARVEPFDEAGCERALRALAERLGVKAAALIHPARVALTGRSVSPGIFAVMAVHGRAGVLERLDRAAHRIEPARGTAESA